MAYRAWKRFIFEDDSHNELEVKTAGFVFTVQPHKPYNFKRIFWYLAIVTVVFSLSGGMFMLFVGEHNMNEYLKYPLTNCTLNATKDSSGNYPITYINNGHLVTTTVSLPEKYFNSNNWTTGSVFVCLYKGNFVASYTVFQGEYKAFENTKWLGFIVPSCFTGPLATICLIIYFVSRREKGERKSLLSYASKKDFVVSNWSVIPVHIRPLISIILSTVYPKAPASICFKEEDNNSFVVKALVIGLSIFSAAFAVGLGLIFPVVLIVTGFYSSDFILAVIFFSFFIPIFFPIVAMLFYAGSLERLVVSTENLVIIFSIYSENKITGYIYPKNAAVICLPRTIVLDF